MVRIQNVLSYMSGAEPRTGYSVFHSEQRLGGEFWGLTVAHAGSPRCPRAGATEAQDEEVVVELSMIRGPSGLDLQFN